MNSVEKDKMELIEQWNMAPIVLDICHIKTLKEIGHTPLDIYGNGSQYHETPCRVITKSGEEFNFAIVVQQRHPPFEEVRKHRLATDIQDIESSPFAFPLKVRLATTQAKEVRLRLRSNDN